MVFSSSLFLLFFLPVFLGIYYLLPHRIRNYWILFSSVLFYSWGAPDFIFIVAGAIILDFFLVRWMNAQQGRLKKILLVLSLILNVGMLAWFKYANFFVENINAILGYSGKEPITWLKIALPIGISFFTFQKLTYTVDVFRKVHTPLEKITDYALYILSFPQLIAGPIVRFHEVADQITNRKDQETVENSLSGFYRFGIGMAKKVMIANTMGEQADIIFAMDTAQLSSPIAWIGILAYTFQIYFDFAGYSDMAIGLGRMMGFRFPENFRNPYISGSITEFWRRWHMTLGRWMRDYLYIPLGGNRVKTGKMFFNLWIVFLISGLWHGAAWTFIIWGAYHGLFLILDRLFLLKWLKKAGKLPALAFTFFLSMMGWVVFRAESMNQAIDYYQALFSFSGDTGNWMAQTRFWVIMGIAAFFSFWAFSEKWEKRIESIWFKQQRKSTLLILVTISLILLIISEASITASGFNPFIYFRF